MKCFFITSTLSLVITFSFIGVRLITVLCKKTYVSLTFTCLPLQMHQIIYVKKLLYCTWKTCFNSVTVSSQRKWILSSRFITGHQLADTQRPRRISMILWRCHQRWIWDKTPVGYIGLSSTVERMHLYSLQIVPTCHRDTHRASAANSMQSLQCKIYQRCHSICCHCKWTSQSEDYSNAMKYI